MLLLESSFLDFNIESLVILDAGSVEPNYSYSLKFIYKFIYYDIL